MVVGEPRDSAGNGLAGPDLGCVRGGAARRSDARLRGAHPSWSAQRATHPATSSNTSSSVLPVRFGTWNE